MLESRIRQGLNVMPHLKVEPFLPDIKAGNICTCASLGTEYAVLVSEHVQCYH